MTDFDTSTDTTIDFAPLLAQYAAKNELRADDGLGYVFDAIRATGGLRTAIDDPDEYVALDDTALRRVDPGRR